MQLKAGSSVGEKALNPRDAAVLYAAAYKHEVVRKACWTLVECMRTNYSLLPTATELSPLVSAGPDGAPVAHSLVNRTMQPGYVQRMAWEHPDVPTHARVRCVPRHPTRLWATREMRRGMVRAQRLVERDESPPLTLAQDLCIALACGHRGSATVRHKVLHPKDTASTYLWAEAMQPARWRAGGFPWMGKQWLKVAAAAAEEARPAAERAATRSTAVRGYIHVEAVTGSPAAYKAEYRLANKGKPKIRGLR